MPGLSDRLMHWQLIFVVQQRATWDRSTMHPKFEAGCNLQVNTSANSRTDTGI